MCAAVASTESIYREFIPAPTINRLKLLLGNDLNHWPRSKPGISSTACCVYLSVIREAIKEADSKKGKQAPSKVVITILKVVPKNLNTLFNYSKYDAVDSADYTYTKTDKVKDEILAEALKQYSEFVASRNLLEASVKVSIDELKSTEPKYESCVGKKPPPPKIFVPTFEQEKMFKKLRGIS